jgi:hypothetical protein
VSLWRFAWHWAVHTLAAGTIFLECAGLGVHSPLAFAQGANIVPQASVASIGVRAPANALSVEDPVRQASEALIQWRKDWENRDFERFSAHYAEAFQSAGIDRGIYLQRKRAIFDKRPWHRIRINEVLWVAEQGSPDLLSVRFIQEYDSPQGSDRSRKEQRWVRANQRWQLANETEVILSETDSSRSRTKSGTGGLGK